MKKLFRITTLSALVASWSVPLLAAAQSGINTTGISRYSTGIVGVINNILVPVLMAIAFIVFLWGVYKYFILGAADETSRKDGRQFTLWGIIGFVVILSLWAFVNLLRGTFGLDNNATAPPPPTIWGTSSGVNSSYQQQNTFGTSGNGQIQYGQNGQSYVFGGGPTQQQQAALNQQYYNMQSVCSQGSTSADCQAAQAAYSASYYSVNPNSNATIQNAESTTVGAGADCTYSPCASGTCNYDANLGYSVCSSGDGFGQSNIDPSDPSDTSGGTTQSPYDICIANGGSPEDCNAI